jgi:hypothetical protein
VKASLPRSGDHAGPPSPCSPDVSGYGAVGGGEPDGAAVAVALDVHPGDDERHVAAVGGEAGGGDVDEATDVGGLHARDARCPRSRRHDGLV